MAEIRPTLSEWDELPYLVQQAFPLVRLWTEEMKAERVEAERKTNAWRKQSGAMA